MTENVTGRIAWSNQKMADGSLTAALLQKGVLHTPTSSPVLLLIPQDDLPPDTCPEPLPL